jgi:[ribosomal protein S5]-alanine N-acetyltransferase
MDPRNIGSEKVAIKCNYKKEGTMKKSIKNGSKFSGAHLYAKVAGSK